VKFEKLSNWLLTIGVLIVVVAVFWSLYTYGIVGTAVASKGLRPNTVIVCLYSFSENCGLMEQVAEERGTIAYSPMVFWFGVLLFIGSIALNLALGGQAGESKTGGVALQRLLIPIDRISTLVGHVFAWCIVLLTFAVSYEVFSRYVFGRPTTWAFDASYILYGALFTMAGAYALCRNAHVRGDFLYRTWRPQVQAGMDLALYFLFFFPGIIAFIFAGYGFAAQSWMVHEHSAYSPAGPPIYHVKTLIPFTGILLLLQGIVEVIRCLICLKTGAWPQRLHDVEELEKVILEQHQTKEGAAP
jgi:TRAP-type mannitol/chloroaromatic compound transport system permease small subunit